MFLSKKKRNILILTILFVLVAIIGGGLYYFLEYYNKTNTNYSVNKYSNLLNWCDNNLNGENSLEINCKSLLLEIKNTSDGNSCFNVQVIAKDNTLQNTSICEKGDSLTYANEVLNFKKLMPIDITLTYKPSGLFKSYTFENVSFVPLDSSFVEDIVDQDLTSLSNADVSKTTIQNSGNFCPNPSTLPSYISDNLKTSYTEFYNKNILGESSLESMVLEDFSNGFDLNWGDKTINTLFTCNSASNSGYPGLCNNIATKTITTSSADTVHLNVTPIWGYNLSDDDFTFVKQISLLSDGLEIKASHSTYITPDLIQDINQRANYSQSINEEEFCDLYSLYNLVDGNNLYFSADKDFIKDQVSKNIGNFSSSTCANIINDKVDSAGMYLNLYYNNLNNNTVLGIYNDCNNLNSYIKNEE